ncbi:MAG: hypothetical protein HY660_03595, partial [Armatimonadetes bacterium]|nr:hypothetical protein [Armatimonadota bacterium]
AALRRAPNMVVAVRKAMAVQAAQAGNLPGTVLPFRSGILLRDLMPRLEAFRKPETRAVAAGVRSKRRGRRKVPGRE